MIRLIFCLLIFLVQLNAINIDLSYPESEWKNALQKDFKTKINLHSLEFKSDIEIDKDELIYLMDLEIDKFFTLNSLVNGFINLKKKNKFKSIDLEWKNGHKGLMLKLFLHAHNTFYKLEIISNIQDKYYYMQLYDIFFADIFNINKHNECIKNIEKALFENGYFNAKIDEKIEINEKKKEISVKLTFTNTEKFIIKDINLDINSFKQHPDLDNIFINSLKDYDFSKTRVQETVKNAQKYLKHQGYFKPKILINTKANYKHKSVKLDFHINLKAIKCIIFHGNSFFGYEDLLNEIVYQEFIIHDIEKLYKDNGFHQIFINLEETETELIFNINEGPQTVEPRITTQENKPNEISSELFTNKNSASSTNHKQQAQFGKFIVRGNCEIKFNNLAKYLYFQELTGTSFNKEALRKIKNKIKSLDIFEKIFILQDNSQNSTKDIILNLIPNYPHEFKARFGFQQISKNFSYKSGATFKLGASFECKNLTKHADIFKFDGDITRYSRGIFLQYLNPCLFNLLCQNIIKGYATSYNQPLFLGSSQTLYKASRDGFSFTLLNEYLNLKTNLNTGIEFLKIAGLSIKTAKQLNYAPDLVDKRVPYFYIEPFINYNNADDYLNPHKSSISLISGRAMIPLNISHGSFIKLCLEQSFVFPIYYNIIFGCRFKIGHIFHKNFANIMPSERFYLGGASSLRGYAPNMVPPLTLVQKCDDGKNYLIPVGGKSMANGNFEIRFPIYNNNIQGVIFSDIGMLAQTKKTIINGSKWVATCGAGVRYITPIGPIRFDVGFKLNKHHIPDKNYAWYLTFGHAF